MESSNVSIYIFNSSHLYLLIERKPALLSNFFFAGIAPFFMVFECMHKLTGYKDAELKELNFIVEADIAHYRLESKIEMRDNIKLVEKKSN